MKLEAIHAEWANDAIIDKQKLDDEALKISLLHAKYQQIYTNERLVLRKYESQLKVLKLDKFEFYTQGPTKETQEKGWKLPDFGKVLKNEADRYVETDQDVIDLSLKIGLQHEKVDLLESIIRTIMNRGFALKTSMDFIRFSSGM